MEKIVLKEKVEELTKQLEVEKVIKSEIELGRNQVLLFLVRRYCAHNTTPTTTTTSTTIPQPQPQPQPQPRHIPTKTRPTNRTRASRSASPTC